ncbi:hypothetical protein MMC34_000900 [Xylographa carneopallida]|nr:hypothetical protein [Xylographa carneopallida]
MSRATNTNKRSQTGGLRGQPSVAHVQYQRQSLRTGPLSEQEHKVDESSDISRGHKKDERENTYKPWGWMSLPSFSEMSEDGHKRQQYPSIELPSQPKLASDCKPEPRPKPTSGFGPKFQRSDIKLLSATSEEPELEEAENDRVTLPATQPTRHGIPGNREHKLLSSSGMIQGGSIKSRKDVGYNQRSPLGRTRLRDKSNFRVPPAAEEMIHKPAQRELSLLEQLFPEEAKTQSKASEHEQNPQEELARLPPPEFDKHHEALSDDSSYTQFSSKLKTREATVSAFRQENTTILLLSRVSTALCDEDFRRIVPRGVHIEEWRGPGDILKVIPSRDISSLSPTSNYYLLFSNPAYARAYQNQAIHLHQLAQTYTPTSLDFPMPPPPGILDSKGQDVYALLQDFTISPPSVRMSLRVLLPPYHANLQRLLENEGYPQLVQSGSKTGSSVLFWVDGHQPSALSVRTMLSKDGLDRGLQWGPLRGHGGIKVLHVHANHDGGEIGENDFTGPGDEYGHSEWKDTELKPKRHGHQRWIIYFEDEAEARRFVRVWHRRPYPFPLQEESPSYGEPQPLVHAEYMW